VVRRRIDVVVAEVVATEEAADRGPGGADVEVAVDDLVHEPGSDEGDDVGEGGEPGERGTTTAMAPTTITASWSFERQGAKYCR
jgi:hypothetical protein